jgi:hypothetical protein
MKEIHHPVVSGLPSDWQTKVWGRTRELIYSPFYSKYELEVTAGGYCSLHYHKARANRFNILSGLIEIIEMIGPFVQKIRLGPDNTYDVPSFVPHMFVVLKTGQMFEEYYPDRGGIVQRDDITRLVEGGRLDLDILQKLPYHILTNLNYDI